MSVSDRFVQDIRFAVRSLIHTPGPTIVVLVTLALGIGANTAVFSVIDTVILEPLPYPHADRLFVIDAAWETTGVSEAPHIGADFQFLERESMAFERLGALGTIRQNLTGERGAEQIDMGLATPEVFTIAGERPALGRVLQPDDPSNTIVISHALWQSYFAGDSSIVGGTANIDGRPVDIVGVLSPSFRIHLPVSYGWPVRVDAWRHPSFEWSNGDLWNVEDLQGAMLRVIGLSAFGTPGLEIDAELNRLAANRRTTLSGHADAGFQLTARPLQRAVAGEARGMLVPLFGAVGLVLLIACVNVANIMLVRAQDRRREVAVRMALGGGRGRIASLMLAESVLLAAAGAAGGIALAWIGVRGLVSMAPPNLPRLDGIGINATVLAFAGSVTVLCTLLFGLVPSIVGSRANPNEVLQSYSRGVTRVGRSIRRALVAAEVSLSFVLLIAAGLLLRTLVTLQDVRPGFDYDDLLTFSVSVPGATYSFPDGTARFYTNLMDRTTALPGVTSAAVVWPLPLEGQTWSGIYLTGDRGVEEQSMANYRVISHTYFETVGARMVEGRTFQLQDPRFVAVVSQQLAERVWPGRSAIGRDIRAVPWGGEPETFEIIGVAEDIRYADLREDPPETIYFSLEGWSWADWEFGAVARTTVPPMSVVAGVKSVLAELDATVPLARPRAMTGYVNDLLATNRFALTLFGVFAGVAVVMATVGVYGVMSHLVSQRTRELGIRMALGARKSGIVRTVVAQGLTMTVAGIGAGAIAALWLTRFVSGLLYGVPNADPVTYGTIVVVIATAGAIASYLPARRAAQVDPVESLRVE